MPYKHLLIVSDTRMQMINGECQAFNSVVKELDVFVRIFDQITWIGYDHSDQQADGTLMRIKYPGVKTILMKRSGGKGFWQKLRVLIRLPGYAWVILKHALKADVIHNRGPSAPMLIALIISLVYRKPKWWFKYANNWDGLAPSFFWGLQKKIMIRNRHSISTVNGQWPGMPDHILAFENPCLRTEQPHFEIIRQKSMQNGWRLLFVGRIEEAKGYKMVLEAIEQAPPGSIASLTIIGNGSERTKLEEHIQTHPLKQKIKYLGPQSYEQVLEQMLQSHFLLLPSTSSEGFPKVVAEAWSQACIPIVSNVSCLEQYVHDGQSGFVWNINGEKSYTDVLLEALDIEEDLFKLIAQEGLKMCHLFTYDHYEKMILQKILKKIS